VFSLITPLNNLALELLQTEHLTDGHQREESKTVCSESKEAIKPVNRLCKQEEMEKGLILPLCSADERTAKYCGVSEKPVKRNMARKSKGK
jgi:hypothetical protein